MVASAEGPLMFRCPKTGEEFDSGFRFTPDALTSIPAGYKMNVRCKSCLQLHEFLLAEAQIAGGTSR
jgi:hypothetical protein